ncbi:hypothetical protein K8T06_03665, partial [bacterium]|nr:hypothetical protein [bacterium]
MRNSIDIIRRILKDKAADMSAGSLIRNSENLTSSDLVNKKIMEFGGQGWVQSTRDRDIEIVKPDKNLSGDLGFVIRAELFDGEKTLHVARTGTKWMVSLITVDREAHGILEKTFAFQHASEETLHYEVEYGLVDVEGHKELQPVDYRFTGWKRG